MAFIYAGRRVRCKLSIEAESESSTRTRTSVRLAAVATVKRSCDLAPTRGASDGPQRRPTEAAFCWLSLPRIRPVYSQVCHRCSQYYFLLPVLFCQVLPPSQRSSSALHITVVCPSTFYHGVCSV